MKNIRLIFVAVSFVTICLAFTGCSKESTAGIGDTEFLVGTWRNVESDGGSYEELFIFMGNNTGQWTVSEDDEKSVCRFDYILDDGILMIYYSLQEPEQNDTLGYFYDKLEIIDDNTIEYIGMTLERR